MHESTHTQKSSAANCRTRGLANCRDTRRSAAEGKEVRSTPKPSINQVVAAVTALALSFSTFIFALTLSGCGAKPPNVTFRFEKDGAGWQGYFADLPSEYEEDIYELEFKHSPVPVAGKNDKGLVLKGHNRSDDLFMFIARKFDKKDGLKPSTAYNVKLSFDLATNVPGGLIGIGGSPGESVYVKAGVVSSDPKPVVTDDGYYRVRLDKRNQAGGGNDIVTLGHIAKAGSDDDSYQYKSFEAEFEVTTNDKGEAWVIIGTDSGFEGLTQVYYTNIKVQFSPR